MTDQIVNQALEAGGAVVLQQVRANLAGVIGRGKANESTGELLSSLGVTPVGTDSDGNYNIKIGFNEPRLHQPAPAKGKRSYILQTNAMIANVLEYGRHNQPARPFLAPARSASRAPCIAAMTAVVEGAVDSV